MKKDKKNVPVVIYMPRTLRRKMKLEAFDTNTNLSALVSKKLLQVYEQKSK